MLYGQIFELATFPPPSHYLTTRPLPPLHGEYGLSKV